MATQIQNRYTLIFEGDLVWDGSGWHGFVLDTPFEYDGTSNLQIVWENRHGTWAPSSPHFFVTEAGDNNVVVGASDASFPTHLPGLTESFFPNLLLTYEVDDEPAQATLVAPVDFATDTASTLSLEWTLGANTTDVDVYFSDILPEVSGLSANAKVVDGQNITSFEVTDLDLLTTYYWRVVTRNSAINLTTNSPMWRFTTGDDGLFTTVTVGDGEVLSYQLPLNYFYYYSLTETIYLADELNIGGELQGITYYNNFGFNVLDSFVNVWVGETAQTDLSSYIPPSQLTQVFSGTLNMPSGENEVNIMFDSPISYSGGNLVLLVGKPLASVYYLDTEEFYCTETEMANRSIYWQNDGQNWDPENMPAGTTTNLMPNTTFQFITTGMGSVVGTVTDGTTPLAGANISIEGTSNQTVTATDGTFAFPYVHAGDNYTLTSSLHGYHDTTVSIDVVADEETVVNVTMNSLPTVAVSGQIKAVDTGLGIQSNFQLTGYEAYEVSSDANGNFTIAAVYANQTYTGYATANGYQVTPVEVIVGSTDLDLGIILINETLFPVSNVIATLTGSDAFISWNTPLEIDGLLSFSDDFEGDMSNWDEVINGPGTPGEDGIPYWHIGAPDDPYDGDCLRVDWGYNIDTWAITPFIAVTANTSINFEFCTSYQWFVSPYGNGDLSIKVSLDGTNWTELWTEEDYGPFADFDWINVNIPLSDYAGQSLQVAFNVTGSDAANLHIDNVFIGESRVNSNFVVATPNTTLNTSAKSMSAANHGYTFTNNRRALVAQNFNNTSRAFESYNLYRFLIVDEENIPNWTLVGEALTDTTYTDSEWSTLTNGFYKYGVTAVYTDNTESIAVLSNWLQNSEMSVVTVNVESNLGEVIADANITLTAQEPDPTGGYAEFNAVTNAAGTAVISVNTGVYDLSISAAGYATYSGEVDASADITVDITLGEIALPPTAVTAVQEGANALITWGEPGGDGSGEWITKGGENNADGIGTGEAAIVGVSHMYTQAELVDYQGMYINSIKFFPREAGATYTLKVWGGATGNVELYSQVVTNFTNEAWNEVALNSSVAIPATGPVYIGYNADTPTGHPAGCDAGPAVPGGDLIKLNNQPVWDSMASIYQLNYNWNIQAYVSWSRSAQVASEGRVIMQRHSSKATQDAQLVRGNLAPIATPSVHNNRALEGYKVWRLLVSDQGNEAYWTSLTTNMITDLTYTDTSWDSLPSGSYRFAVKAIYTNDNSSPAAFSNILLKDMYGMVDGVVMDESNAPINNATVNFTGGTATTDASGYFLFTDVFAGDYEITATATGYIPETQNITVIGTQLTSVNFTLAISDIVISDSFESYPDFAIQAAPWVMVDVDLLPTFGIGEVTYPNAYDPKAYIIFNHLMTTPPVTENFAARTGVKYAACFAADPGPNNDWMMTEPINLADSGTFSFWGRSVVDTYGLERFNVLVSTGSTNPSDFVSISGPTFVEAPINWTNFTYNLDAYANQTIRVAIQCVSNNAFMFMVDDVVVDAPGATDNENNEAVAISSLVGNYPNPFNPETTISFSTKESGQVSLDIYNIRGQKVRTLLNDHKDAGNHNVVWNGKDDSGKSVASGVFFYRMKSGKFSSTKKMILMK